MLSQPHAAAHYSRIRCIFVIALGMLLIPFSVVVIALFFVKQRVAAELIIDQMTVDEDGLWTVVVSKRTRRNVRVQLLLRDRHTAVVHYRGVSGGVGSEVSWWDGYFWSNSGRSIVKAVQRNESFKAEVAEGRTYWLRHGDELLLATIRMRKEVDDGDEELEEVRELVILVSGKE